MEAGAGDAPKCVHMNGSAHAESTEFAHQVAPARFTQPLGALAQPAAVKPELGRLSAAGMQPSATAAPSPAPPAAPAHPARAAVPATQQAPAAAENRSAAAPGSNCSTVQANAEAERAPQAMLGAAFAQPAAQPAVKPEPAIKAEPGDKLKPLARPPEAAAAAAAVTSLSGVALAAKPAAPPKPSPAAVESDSDDDLPLAQRRVSGVADEPSARDPANGEWPRQTSAPCLIARARLLVTVSCDHARDGRKLRPGAAPLAWYRSTRSAPPCRQQGDHQNRSQNGTEWQRQAAGGKWYCQAGSQKASCPASGQGSAQAQAGTQQKAQEDATER